MSYRTQTSEWQLQRTWTWEERTIRIYPQTRTQIRVDSWQHRLVYKTSSGPSSIARPRVRYYS